MTHLKNIKIALFIFTILIAFAACKSNSKPETRDIQFLNDSSTYHNNTSSDTSKVTQTNVIPQKGNIKHDRVNPGGNSNAGGTKSSNSGTATSGNNGSGSNSGTVSNSGSGSTQAAPKKKGWSKAAQGAAIGGVGGAVAGAIISKKKGTGAVVGGVVGAAGGYIIGRGKDKKDGRVKN